MPYYSYIASDTKGATSRGAVYAYDKGDLTSKLRQKSLFLVSFRVEQDAPEGDIESFVQNNTSTGDMGSPPSTAAPNGLGLGPGTAPGGSMVPSRPMSAQPRQRTVDPALIPKHQVEAPVSKVAKAYDPRVRPKGKISLKELTIMTRQLSISINAGMSFVDAIQTITNNARNPLTAWVTRRILDDILAGKKFSESLAAHPDIFKAVYVSMAASGEVGGFMPEALNRTAAFLEKEMDLQKKVKSALIYPVMIAVVAVVVVTGMMMFIVPTFVDVFKEMNAPMPLPTKMLISASNFTRAGGFLTPFLFVGLILGAMKYKKKNERFRRMWDEKILQLPVLGNLVTLEIITRFIRTLASLVENGVPAMQAINISRQVVENRSIERVVDDIYSSVQQGQGISPVLYRSKYFPVLVANMVATGEKTGSIPEVLNKMADYYDEEVATAIRDMLTMMEPLLIVFMAVVVGFIIAGLMLPTFQLSSVVN